ncbi:MAG: sulfate ABC transporter permease subunit CysW [Candidatus Methylacidiphilales bacterium]|nr:sulfate ABC transporter permease subunit CysW [Candidatus Methylacidiphilales bacterium]
MEQPVLRQPLTTRHYPTNGTTLTMGATIAKRIKAGSRYVHSPAMEDPLLARVVLMVLCFGFIGLFLLLPLVAVFFEAFRKGAGVYLATFQDSAARHAVFLTLTVALIAVPLNTVFGLASAWAITKFQFKGKQILITLIDLPFAVSPVISGLVFVVIFASHGWAHPLLENSVAGLAGGLPILGQNLAAWFAEHQAVLAQGFWGFLYHEWRIQILFAVPGLVLATCFVTFPFVAREIIPLMQAQGNHEEQAAISLGAGGWQTLWRVTLPNIKWALLHGVILCNARAMGEFGAVSVVSGHIRGQTNTIPLQIEILYNEYLFASSFALASLLAFLALVTIVVKAVLESLTRADIEES